MPSNSKRKTARVLQGLPYETIRIPLGKLSVHPKVQRQLRPKWAARIAKDFDESAFDVLYVNRQGKNLFIFDGQHRAEAAKIYLGDGWEVVEVPCRVYDDLDIPALATLTGGKNNSLNWTAIAEFRRAVLAGDPVAVAISKMLKGFGLYVHEDSNPNSVRAVKALRDVYGWTPDGPALLTLTVGLLHTAWPEDKDALHQVLIRGMALFLRKHGEEIDRDAFLHRLQAHVGASVLLGQARNYAAATGVSTAHGALKKLQDTYNTKRRSGRLNAA